MKHIYIFIGFLFITLTQTLFALDVTVNVGESIQDAIDDVSSSGGGILTLETGTHTITATLEMKSNVTFQGSGIFESTVKINQNKQIMAEDGYSAGRTNSVNNVLIQNVTFIGVNGDEGGVAITQQGTDNENITFLNVRCYEVGWGVHIKGAKNVLVENCDFSRNGAIGKEGFAHNLYLRRVYGVKVKNSTFNNSISANGINISYSEDIEVTNCEMIGNYFRGVRAADSDGFLVHNCVVIGNGNVGILANTEVVVTKNIDFQYNCVANNGTGIESKNGATGICKNNNSYGNTGLNYILKGSITQSGNTSDANQACGEVGSCNNTAVKIEAECYDDMYGVKIETGTEGDNINYLVDGDWSSYTNIDLTGMNSIDVRVASSTLGGDIEIRLGSETGTLVGMISVENTGGNQVWETVSANIDRVVGNQNLYVVCKGDAGYLYNINWFSFSEDVLCANTVFHIEAECYDGMSGIRTEDCDEGTLNVGWIEEGDWMMYSGLDLSGMNSIKARLSGKTTGNTVEVRIDDQEGDLIGEIEVANTDGNQNWITDSVNIETVGGVHDVYLVFTGGDGYLFNINHFGFSEEQLVVTSLNDGLSTRTMVYPNPAKEELFINGLENGTYELFDNSGVIYKLGSIESENEVVNINGLNKGVYFLKVIHAESTETIKVIKK